MSEPQPRILLLTTAYLPLVGGSERAIYEITRRLPEFIFDIVTARYSSDVLRMEQSGNVRVFRVGGSLSRATFGLPKLLLPFVLAKKARELMREHTYRIVHAYQASQAAGAGWLLKGSFPHVPFVITLQEGKDLSRQSVFTKFARKVIFRRADAATAISSYLKEYAERLRSGIPVVIIPNGASIEVFQSAEDMRVKLGIRPDEKVIVSVSRLVEKNGIANLIYAFQKVRKNIPAKLVLIGDGPLREELEALSRTVGIQDDVLFLGTVAHDHVSLYLRVADVFIRASLSEGLGIAFLEAMAAGVPIIGSPVGGIPDFLHDEQTGLFCNPNDPGDIARSIERILDDEALRQRLIRNGRDMVARRYSWDTIAHDMRVFYNCFEP